MGALFPVEQNPPRWQWEPDLSALSLRWPCLWCGEGGVCSSPAPGSHFRDGQLPAVSCVLTALIQWGGWEQGFCPQWHQRAPWEQRGHKEAGAVTQAFMSSPGSGTKQSTSPSSAHPALIHDQVPRPWGSVPRKAQGRAWPGPVERRTPAHDTAGPSVKGQQAQCWLLRLLGRRAVVAPAGVELKARGMKVRACRV